MIANYLDMRGRSGPLGFFVSFVVLAALGCGLVLLVHNALHANHHLSGIVVFLAILTGIIFTSILLTQAVKRVNDMGKAGIFAIFCIFPAACVPLFWFYPFMEVLSSPPRMLLFTLGLIGMIILMLPRSTATRAGN